MEIRICRDCANFEDRRDVDSTALCKKNLGPYICCEEFKPRDESIDENRLYYRFCSKCTYYEEVNGTSICAKNHTPGVACEEFIERFEKMKITRQNNHMKSALIAHAINNSSSPDPVLHSLIEISRKIGW